MEQNIKTDFEKLLHKSTFSNNEKDTKRKSLNNFLKKGFPNRKLEEWKFSDISQVIQKNIGELSFYNDFNVKNEVDETIFIKNICSQITKPKKTIYKFCIIFRCTYIKC